MPACEPFAHVVQTLLAHIFQRGLALHVWGNFFTVGTSELLNAAFTATVGTLHAHVHGKHVFHCSDIAHVKGGNHRPKHWQLSQHTVCKMSCTAQSTGNQTDGADCSDEARKLYSKTGL